MCKVDLATHIREKCHKLECFLSMQFRTLPELEHFEVDHILHVPRRPKLQSSFQRWFRIDETGRFGDGLTGEIEIDFELIISDLVLPSSVFGSEIGLARFEEKNRARRGCYEGFETLENLNGKNVKGGEEEEEKQILGIIGRSRTAHLRFKN